MNSLPILNNKDLFPTEIKDVFSRLKPVIVIGRGEVFQKKIKPALEHLGVRDFLIFDPGYAGPGKVDSLDSLPAGHLALVLSPNNFHLDQALELIRQDVSFYVEKPVCINSRELEILAAALRSQRAKIYFGDYYFFKGLPLTNALNASAPYGQWLSGTAATLPGPEALLRVEGRLHEGGEAACGALGPRTWLSQAASGGGMLLDLMIHLTNIIGFSGLRLTEIRHCSLFSRITEKSGAFEELSSPDLGEDMGTVSAWLNQSVPLELSVAKYAPEHDRWLKLCYQNGLTATLSFEAVNTLTVEDPVNQHHQVVSLTIDPYLLTMYDALGFLQDDSIPIPAERFFKEQAASVALIEKMKELYWKSRS